jgi:hypothetical protein
MILQRGARYLQSHGSGLWPRDETQLRGVHPAPTRDSACSPFFPRIATAMRAAEPIKLGAYGDAAMLNMNWKVSICCAGGLRPIFGEVDICRNVGRRGRP